ncbi:MAG: hypothetical protein MUE75_17855 [Algoriphagus sp.]|jgi:hypothetical protein|nr:hypothetical protein [Algoriphagus sp.]
MRTLDKIRLGWSVCIFALTVVCFSCVETVENQTLVYSNNFSTVDLAGFENARLFVWRNDTIAGFYHNEEVAVTIDNLPTHNYLKVSVEVLIHDSWDGNVDDGLSGPDYWFMGLDETETYRTTFSNTPCAPTYCLYQSYPNTFFRQNRPKTGAVDVNMPGLCLFGRTDNYTTRYVVEQLIEHSQSEVRLFMGDELKQTNSPSPICDESWSIASIRVSAIQTNN